MEGFYKKQSKQGKITSLKFIPQQIISKKSVFFISSAANYRNFVFSKTKKK